MEFIQGKVGLTEDISQNTTGIVDENKPTCIIVLGMAGSGKTTFVTKIVSTLLDSAEPYVINLDPACKDVPYPTNIDIRDSINYKEVMKQYKLGPNGGIVTALNLFSTKFGQVINLIEKAGKDHKYVVIDTPGQLEVFTWSASGEIIIETLASHFPTIVVYVMDSVRSIKPVTFMSNMLYASSILYKTNKLPLIVVMNKTDIQDNSKAVEWMKDYNAFIDALDTNATYISDLTRSMALYLDEFYSNLHCCGVSSTTGIGISDFLTLVKDAQKDYYKYIERKRKIHKKKLTKTNSEDIPVITKLSIGRDISDFYLKNLTDESSDEEKTKSEV